MDMESGSVRAKTEPENKGDDAQNCEKTQENGADDFGDSGGEAITDTVDVVSGSMTALIGFGFPGGFELVGLSMIDGYLAVSVHFGSGDGDGAWGRTVAVYRGIVLGGVGACLCSNMQNVWSGDVGEH